MAASPGTRRAILILTWVVIVATAITNVPRAYVDFAGLPLLEKIRQPEHYGTDTIADMYEARVVLNDASDMYTKALVPQTAFEAHTWSKEASAPYPPATLLAEAGLYALGTWSGVGFYGVIAALAFLFLALSAWYAHRTRWYIFPLLYLSFSYLGERFFRVQDGSYLIMLNVVMAALVLARQERTSAHLLMAVATTLKLSPAYYVRHLAAWSRPVAAAYIGILALGLVVPIFIWENYLYIYTFHRDLKGGVADTVAAIGITLPFTVLLWYIETRLPLQFEDRIGWALVPGAMFMGLMSNTARHLVLALLIPDRRGVRNVVAAVGLLLPAVLPGIVRPNSALLICSALLVISLAVYLGRIGWDVVIDDLRHPSRTVRMMLRDDQSPIGWSSTTAPAV